MSGKQIEFDPSAILGRAFRIDTASVWAEVVDHEKLTRTGVGNLLAFQGATSSEYLIAVLDRVTRDLQDEILEGGDEGAAEDIPPEVQQRDLLRAVLLGTYRQMDGTSTGSFKRGADSYPLVDSPCWVIDGLALQQLMGLLASQLEPDKRLELGHFVADRSAVAVADGDRLFQRHAALLGSTGSGKSWTVALILERASRLAHPNLIVFDMHGEYGPLTEGSSAVAKGWRIAGPADLESSDSNVLYLPWWLLNQEEMQALLLDRSEDNAPNQAARLTDHVRDLKSEALKADSREDVLARFTVDSPVPYSIRSLVERLRADDVAMVAGASRDKQGPFFGRLTRFISRLESKLADRRYGFMFGPPESEVKYEWLHQFAKSLLGSSPGIKVIDFSEVPSDVLPIVVGVFARVLYEVHFWTEPERRTPVTFVCDEAHLYLPAHDPGAAESRALDAFERIAKEGRKYGLSLMVVSQRPSDVSRTVLSQCNNFIVLRLTNDQDQSVIRRLMPDSLESLTASLPLLDVGEALVLGDAMILPTRIKLDKPQTKPRSATLNFWTEWNETPVVEADLVAAVEAMRRQSRILPADSSSE
ncbi:ATP-binding protein [Cellulomonas sp. P24]|uniref:ATP-binding protein n=1 Tax=Cellulomonas sp. P24 TaxID=2885206 RepID=UPI00216B1DF2|nr:ATP-binding protein [Cellulomonas sp. P24]MCR6493168.1 ATP-binding protein [Cellulomonas sp. P24]